MATTPLEVFEYAMALTDNLDSTGDADTTDNADYKNRTLGILNVLIPEYYTASDTYLAATAGTRPIATALTGFSDEICLDDAICRNVLPYALASYLTASDNNQLAPFFAQKAEENLKKFMASIPAVTTDIVDLYGVSELGEFASW